MIEQNKATIGGEIQLTTASEAFEMASAIYENINQVTLPGIEVSRYDLYRGRPRNGLSELTDFFKDFADGYKRESIDYHIEPEYVWTLEQTTGSEFLRMPVRAHFVKQGLLLGTQGKLIEVTHRKYDNHNINYKILDEKSIKYPGHVVRLLGKFASENSIDHSAR